MTPRSVLITGCNRGIGLELVKQFLKVQFIWSIIRPLNNWLLLLKIANFLRKFLISNFYSTWFGQNYSTKLMICIEGGKKQFVLSNSYPISSETSHESMVKDDGNAIIYRSNLIFRQPIHRNIFLQPVVIPAKPTTWMTWPKGTPTSTCCNWKSLTTQHMNKSLKKFPKLWKMKDWTCSSTMQVILFD